MCLRAFGPTIFVVVQAVVVATAATIKIILVVVVIVVISVVVVVAVVIVVVVASVTVVVIKRVVVAPSSWKWCSDGTQNDWVCCSALGEHVDVPNGNACTHLLGAKRIQCVVSITVSWHWPAVGDHNASYSHKSLNETWGKHRKG